MQYTDLYGQKQDPNNTLILYHGSQAIIDSPKYGYGNPANDYGLGFYATQNYSLACEWSVLGSGEDGYVNCYNIDVTGLQVLQLSCLPSTHWIAALMKYRGGSYRPRVRRTMQRFISKYLIDLELHDLVIGWRADDSYYQFVQDFILGDLSMENLEEAMHLGDLGTQVCVKSKIAFHSLQFLRAEKALAATHYELALKRDHHAREEYERIASSDFASRGTRITDMI